MPEPQFDHDWHRDIYPLRAIFLVDGFVQARAFESVLGLRGKDFLSVRPDRASSLPKLIRVGADGTLPTFIRAVWLDDIWPALLRHPGSEWIRIIDSGAGAAFADPEHLEADLGLGEGNEGSSAWRVLRSPKTERMLRTARAVRNGPSVAEQDIGVELEATHLSTMYRLVLRSLLFSKGRHLQARAESLVPSQRGPAVQYLRVTERTDRESDQEERWIAKFDFPNMVLREMENHAWLRHAARRCERIDATIYRMPETRAPSEHDIVGATLSRMLPGNGIAEGGPAKTLGTRLRSWISHPGEELPNLSGLQPVLDVLRTAAGATLSTSYDPGIGRNWRVEKTKATVADFFRECFLQLNGFSMPATARVSLDHLDRSVRTYSRSGWMIRRVLPPGMPEGTTTLRVELEHQRFPRRRLESVSLDQASMEWRRSVYRFRWRSLERGTTTDVPSAADLSSGADAAARWLESARWRGELNRALDSFAAVHRPLAMLSRLLTRLGDNHPGDPSGAVGADPEFWFLQCPVHGDLHLDNIIVTDEDHYSVIDLANLFVSAASLDLARIELSLLTDAVVPALYPAYVPSDEADVALFMNELCGTVDNVHKRKKLPDKRSVCRFSCSATEHREPCETSAEGVRMIVNQWDGIIHTDVERVKEWSKNEVGESVDFDASYRLTRLFVALSDFCRLTRRKAVLDVPALIALYVSAALDMREMQSYFSSDLLAD